MYCSYLCVRDKDVKMHWKMVYQTFVLLPVGRKGEKAKGR